MEDDGLIAAQHCLEAMDGQDLETRQALWRAACRYAEKGRDARSRLAGRASLQAVGSGRPATKEAQEAALTHYAAWPLTIATASLIAAAEIAPSEMRSISRAIRGEQAFRRSMSLTWPLLFRPTNRANSS